MNDRQPWSWGEVAVLVASVMVFALIAVLWLVFAA